MIKISQKNIKNEKSKVNMNKFIFIEKYKLYI